MKLPTVRKYPKVLHITPEVDYQLKFVRKLVDGGGNSLDGECDSSEHLIKVRLGQSPEETFKTTLHEVIHALSDEYDLELNEKKVRQLEKALGDFLLMNF